MLQARLVVGVLKRLAVVGIMAVVVMRGITVGMTIISVSVVPMFGRVIVVSVSIMAMVVMGRV